MNENIAEKLKKLPKIGAIVKTEDGEGIVESIETLKEKISITIDNDILEKIKKKAELDDRSLSQYINLVLKQHITAIEEKKQ